MLISAQREYGAKHILWSYSTTTYFIRFASDWNRCQFRGLELGRQCLLGAFIFLSWQQHNGS